MVWSLCQQRQSLILLYVGVFASWQEGGRQGWCWCVAAPKEFEFSFPRLVFIANVNLPTAVFRFSGLSVAPNRLHLEAAIDSKCKTRRRERQTERRTTRLHVPSYPPITPSACVSTMLLFHEALRAPAYYVGAWQLSAEKQNKNMVTSRETAISRR